MPLFYYVCSKCGGEARKILAAASPIVPCPVEGCGGEAKRAPRGVSTKTVEVIDRPHMARRLERLVDAETIFRERAQKDKL